MKILITGALGHIGSQLIRHLPESAGSDEIILLDDLSTQRYCSLFNLPPGRNFRFVEADILKAELDPIFAGVDIVVHLAAMTNAAGSFNQAEKVEAVNFTGTERVAHACAKAGAKLIFLSTTSVYGTQEAIVDENCTVDELRPQSPYAESKLKAERFLADLAKKQKFNYVICRFGTIFGVSPGMRFHTAINKFCWQAVMGQPLTVWKTALDQKRPYLELNDGVRALNYIIRNWVPDNQVYNVLTANATVGEIIGEIRGHIPNAVVDLVDSKIMNQLSYTVDYEKFRKAGFEPQGKLALGVRETIEILLNANTHALVKK